MENFPIIFLLLVIGNFNSIFCLLKKLRPINSILCVYAAYFYVCLPCACLKLEEVTRGCRIPDAEVTDGCEPPSWGWKLPRSSVGTSVYKLQAISLASQFFLINVYKLLKLWLFDILRLTSANLVLLSVPFFISIFFSFFPAFHVYQ